MKFWDCITPITVPVYAIVIGLGLGTAYAHDHDRPWLSQWYTTLKSGKGYCCDGSEAEVKHLNDIEWKTVGGHYQVYINQYRDGSGLNMWVDVPDEAVVKEPNLDGRPTVWPVWGTQPWIRCFMPGQLT